MSVDNRTIVAYGAGFFTPLLLCLVGADHVILHWTVNAWAELKEALG